jgi:hypothetical protein
MNTREQLNHYLRGLESRLRLQAVSRGAAVALGVALGATLVLVLITNAFAFSPTSLVIARITLFLALAFALGLALVMPLLRLNQRRAAGRAESVFPGFQERLVTYVERRDDGTDPFIDILAADTLEHAPQAPSSQVVTQKSIFAFATSAGAAGALLLWMIIGATGFLGYGARLLWAGTPKDSSVEGGFYRITVDPGDKLVRRRSDMPIRATLVGFQAPQVRLMARYKSSAKWEEAPMLPRASDSSYEYLFAAVPEPVEYYVEAAGVKSKTYKLDVIDLAGVKNIKVTYHYPAWLGKKDDVENPGGDLRAVVKTVAELEVETDRPLKNGIIELNDGTRIDLEAKQGNFLTAKVPIEKDGAYHFAAVEGSENVRITQDYFIEAKLDEAPSVKITHPGADAKVSPIEEVTITVEGSDDFGLQSMDLHYSVNGQPEKVVSLLNSKGTRGEGKVVLNLEDFKLVPGDVVSMYATANDARSKTIGDITFIEAQPFEKNYSQSQQGGGGGGGGGGQQNDPSQITQRQKEIIAATHNFNRGSKDAQANAENAQYLSEVQTKLKEQAESMAKRTTARELSTENQDFQSFTKEMEAAAAEMTPAASKLKNQKWADALEPENKALQHLSRAMATFRDIQVSRGQQGGGGGGGGGADAGRDLANLFDLELDTEKNQYESQQSSSGDKQQQEIDNAMQKLEQLARRQQQLAQQNQNNKQQASVDRRWEQEQLRREAEELRKQLQQLQQQQQGQQGQQGQLSRNGQQSQSGQQGKQGQQGQSGQQSASNRQSQQQIQQMMDRIQQAQDDMRASQQAQQQGNQGQADAAARRAAERMQEARDMADRMKRQDTAGQLGDLQQRADQVGEMQKELENQLRQGYAGNSKDGKGGSGLNRQQSEQLASELEKNLQELKKLEQDIQRSARDLRATQPDASTRLRDGVSEIQQNDVERRMQYSSEYIRNGRGDQVNQSGWLPPVNRAMDKMREGVRQAQQALNDGSKQGAGKNERDQQLAQVESLRRQIEQFSRGQQPNGQQPGNQQGQDGKQGGQQPGQQQGQGQGKGQGKDGQQPGQGQGQGGGNQNGGNQFGGGGNRGGAYVGGQFGRWNPQGFYDMPDGRRVEPGQVTRDFARELNDMRQRFRDDPDMSRQIAEVEKALTQASVGDTSGPVLQERLSRTVLPQLETLEVQMRQKLGEASGGQVRSAGTDRMPAGYAGSIAEYFRQLGKGKTQ